MMKTGFPRRQALLLALAPLLLIAGCGKEPVLKVDQAIVKLSPVENNPSAMYFTIHGGPRDVELVSVSSRSAVRAELHESKVDPKSGMTSMERITRLPVPRGSKIEFRQGGKHIMLWGINYPARRLQEIEMEFVFSNGDRILVETPIEPVGSAAGGHENH